MGYNFMSRELIQILSSCEFREDGSISIVDASLQGGRLALQFDVCLPDPIPIQRWHVTCDFPDEHQVFLGRHDDLEFSTDHVLLWPYHQPKARVSFLGTALDPFRVVGALHSAHHSCVGSWFPFERFLNQNLTLNTLLERPAGMVAHGPLSLMEAYRDTLISVGLEATLSDVSLPTEWNGSAWVGISTPRMVALFGRRSFVIGKAFQVTQVDSKHE